MSTIIFLKLLTRPLLIAGLTVFVRRFGPSVPSGTYPFRMAVSAAFVLGLTPATQHLGAQLSGLLTPFLVFVLILAVFCRLHEGGAAAAAMMRGVVLGSLSFGAFFVTVASVVAS